MDWDNFSRKYYGKIIAPLITAGILVGLALSTSKVEAPPYFYTSKNCVENAEKKVDELGLGYSDFDKLNNLYTKKGIIYHLEETDSKTGECLWKKVDEK